jgi:hypothetical protein
MVVVAGSGIAYIQAKGYTAGISVFSDILYGSYSDQPRHFSASNQVAHRLAIFAVEITPAQTRALAKSCVVQKKGVVQTLHFQTPEGTPAELELLDVPLAIPK